MNTPKNNIVLINETSREISETIFQKIFEMVAPLEGISPEKTINLKLTADDTIKELNQRFLGKNEFTDVIAFPFEGEQIPLLGDIIIDINVAHEQKEERTLEEELEILFLHGVLHLLGYDHLAPEDKRVMRSKEDFYRKLLKQEIK